MEIFDPRRSDTLADPYPALAELRARAPVSWNTALRGWLVTRYRDVRQALFDPRLSADRITPVMESLPPARRVALSGLERMLTRFTVFTDPPAHARLRGALSAAFTPNAVSALAGRIQSRVAELIDRAVAAGSLDLIADFASPLSGGVMAGLLGLSPRDMPRFATWCDALAVLLGGAPPAANAYDRAAYRLAEMDAQLRAIVRARRAGGSRGDAIDAIAAADAGGRALDDDELVASVMLILVAGHQTTIDLIGNGLLALLRHPAELARLRAGPDLAASAVEELVRYDGPTACVTRVAAEDVELGGRRIRRGDTVFLMINSANRDTAEFADPDRVDIARVGNRHIAFGHGAHYCLGAPLARLQGQIALRALVARFGAIDLVEGPLAWRDSVAQRGLASLKLRVTPL